MNVYCETSISTSSRLSPLEEEELRNTVMETPKDSEELPDVSLKKEKKQGFDSSTEIVANEIANVAIRLGKKKSRRIPIGVVNKDNKHNSNREKLEGRSQIQATATMDDLECESLGCRQSDQQNAYPVDSIATSTKPADADVLAKPDSSARDDAISELPFDPLELKDITKTKPVPSIISEVSTSPTLTSASFYKENNPSEITRYGQQCQQYQQNRLSYTSSSIVLEPANPPVSHFRLEPEYFTEIFDKLAAFNEELELLNDQILEAMTLHQSMNLSTIITIGDESTSPVLSKDSQLPSSEGSKRRTKGKERAIDLEEERFSLAKSFADIVMESWPRIYKIPSKLNVIQTNKYREKTATKLKDKIVEFWSHQSQFQEQAQLVLDAYEDPSELEYGDRIRILKSRHLDNLLTQGPLDLQEIQRLREKYHQHQENLTPLSDQLQNVWLGIVMLLGDPDHKQSLKHNRRLSVNVMDLNGASSSSSYYLDIHSPPLERRGGMFQLSHHIRLALKVTVLLAVGSGLIAMAMVLNAK
ncbi:hypothetical protein BGZ76_009771 [Entomortierella beljakovae]|nr:hypothetical protein BGZ76_009771 [Entomortierella beljakovae]